MSYSRKDDAVMRRIVAFLRKQGIIVWVDNEKLIPGTPIWEEEIEKAIKGASAIVVVLSPDSKNSEWVRREISLADQYRKRVFPVLVRGDEETSISLRLINRQYVDIRNHEDAGLLPLTNALSIHLQELFGDISSTNQNIKSAQTKGTIRQVTPLEKNLPQKNITRITEIQKKISHQQPKKFLLGIAGTITLVLVTYALWFSKNPLQTNPATSEAPISTQNSNQSNLTSTPTELNLNPFHNDCIKSADWAPLEVDNDQNNECLSLENWGLIVSDGNLIISKSSSSESIRQGIFTSITSGTKISFNLKLNTLITPYENNLANLSIGVIPKNLLSDLATTSLLIYQKENPKKGYPIYLKIKERGDLDVYLQENGDYRKYTESTTEEVIIEFSKTNQVKILIGNSPVIQLDLPFQDTIFWIGYLLPENGKIYAEISDFIIEKDQ